MKCSANLRQGPSFATCESVFSSRHRSCKASPRPLQAPSPLGPASRMTFGSIGLPTPALSAAPRTAASASEAPPAGKRTSDDLSSAVSLDNVRQSLIRQEDTIIFALIERAQFAKNEPVYQPDAIPVPGFKPDGRRYSLLEWLLRETEQVHGRIRRYTSPDEHPFYPQDQPALVLPPIRYNEVLHPPGRAININAQIMDLYMEELLPGITAPGDDNNHGSSAMHDVLCLQALSKRIHYGKFVAEAKFRAKPEEYSQLIRDGDAAGLMRLLTDEAVEDRVVQRVRRKAATYGQDLAPGEAAPANGNGQAANYKVSPDLIAELYRRWVMPLTKEVQVSYLLKRLDGVQ